MVRKTYVKTPKVYSKKGHSVNAEQVVTVQELLDAEKHRYRLVESIRELRRSEHELGKVAGSVWALKEADAQELNQLNRTFSDGDNPTANDIAETIGADPEPIFGDGYSELTEFYCGGFIAGALEEFRQASKEA